MSARHQPRQRRVEPEHAWTWVDFLAVIAVGVLFVGAAGLICVGIIVALSLGAL